VPDNAEVAKLWRVGSKVPINVYEGDRPVCQCQTAIDAKRIVEAVNAAGYRAGEAAQLAKPKNCPTCRSERPDLLCCTDAMRSKGIYICRDEFHASVYKPVEVKVGEAAQLSKQPLTNEAKILVQRGYQEEVAEGIVARGGKFLEAALAESAANTGPLKEALSNGPRSVQPKSRGDRRNLLEALKQIVGIADIATDPYKALGGIVTIAKAAIRNAQEE
jgi:hypothetical protein